MIRKTSLWIAFGLLAAVSILFTVRYYHVAFPILKLDIQMDRGDALRQAAFLAEKFELGPDDYRQAASFHTDSQVQFFIELEGGGVEALDRLKDRLDYHIYTWQVRHFQIGEVREVTIVFTPAGKPHNFMEIIPESAEGINISQEAARETAARFAREEWSLDIDDFSLLDQSMETRSGGRLDHSLVYERNDIDLGAGSLRLKIVISGNRVSELTNYVHIPEAFNRRYEESRSANGLIFGVSTGLFVVLYLILGCGVGLYFMLKERRILWRKPLFWGLFIALFSGLVPVNNWPLVWMTYDTALPVSAFYAQQFLGIAFQIVFMGLLMSASFMAAESLTRKAFPNHIQFWKIWSRDIANSTPVLGRTVGGYLYAAVFLAFTVGVYAVARNRFGWWLPLDAITRPDILASHYPWFNSIAISLQAGFWEECLFRAVPLAGAALLGNKFGYRKIWIFAALIIQALIFGGGHANYLTQPSYARIVELFIPSLVFGIVYLRFGLLPGIICHFLFDVVAFGFPIFSISASGIWLNKAMIILFILIPILVIAFRAFQTKRWHSDVSACLNSGWTVRRVDDSIQPEPASFHESTESSPISRPVIWGTVALAIVALITWILASDFKAQAPRIEIDRPTAEKIADSYLDVNGYDLDATWKTLSWVSARPDEGTRFVWQMGDARFYKKLSGKYLPTPLWIVRYAKFEGDVVDRAEEFQVMINHSGQVSRFLHLLPESKPGGKLEKEQARRMARDFILKTFQLSPDDLIETSVIPIQLKNRLDWSFEFNDPASDPSPTAKAMISVSFAGDRVSDYSRFIQAPEDWERQDRIKAARFSMVKAITGGGILVVFIGGFVGGIVYWSRKRGLPKRVFFATGFAWFALQIVKFINSWPTFTSWFQTASPFNVQIISTIGVFTLTSLLSAIALAFTVTLIFDWREEERFLSGKDAALVGISLGFVILVLFPIANHLAPNTQPMWHPFGAAGERVPVFSMALFQLEQFFSQGAISYFLFLFLNRLSRRGRHWKIPVFTFIFLFGLAMAGARNENLTGWLISGPALGAMLIIAYILIIRKHPSLVLFVIATICVFENGLKGVIQNPHPGAILGNILGFVAVMLALAMTYRKLAK